MRSNWRGAGAEASGDESPGGSEGDSPEQAQTANNSASPTRETAPARGEGPDREWSVR